MCAESLLIGFCCQAQGSKPQTPGVALTMQHVCVLFLQALAAWYAVVSHLEL